MSLIRNYTVVLGGAKTIADSQGKSFTAYILQVSQDNRRWDVFKRFSEFYTFHKALQKQFPNEKFDLPSKNTLVKGQQLIDKRVLALGKFLSQVLKHPMVKMSDSVVTFLEPSLNLPASAFKSPQYSGFLTIQTIKGRKPFWCILDKSRLYYYPSADSKKPTGSINIGYSRIEEAGKLGFKITDLGELSISAFCESQSALDGWLKQLKSSSNVGRAATQATSSGVGIVSEAALPMTSIPQTHSSGPSPSSVFIGATLASVMAREDHQDRKVPLIVSDVIEYLRAKKAHNHTGLFRIPGSADRVQYWADRYDQNLPVNLLENEPDHEVVCSLLTFYFRKLPQPILTFTHYKQFLDVGTTKDLDLKGRALAKLLTQIPAHNRNLAQYVCEYLHFVSKFEETNKMSPANLATCLRSNFMRPQKDDPHSMFSQIPAGLAVLSLLISQYEYFFGPSSDSESSSKSNSNVEDDGDVYDESIGTPVDVEKALPPGGLWVISAYDYDTDTEGELPFHEGDKILLVEKDDDSNWWMGKLNGKGEALAVPLTYVALLEDKTLWPFDPESPPSDSEETNTSKTNDSDSSTSSDSQESSDQKGAMMLGSTNNRKVNRRKAVTQSVMFGSSALPKSGSKTGSRSNNKFGGSNQLPAGGVRSSMRSSRIFGAAGSSGILKNRSKIASTPQKTPSTISNAQKLVTAAQAGQLEIVNQILKVPKPTIINYKDNRGRTALFWACRRNHVDIVKALIAANVDVDIADNHGDTPLASGCIQSPIITELLLQANADPNITNKWGFAPIHHCALNERPKSLKALLLHPDIDISLKVTGDVKEFDIQKGLTAMQIADKKKSGVCRALLEKFTAQRQATNTAAELVYGKGAADLARPSLLQKQNEELMKRLDALVKRVDSHDKLEKRIARLENQIDMILTKMLTK